MWYEQFIGEWYDEKADIIEVNASSRGMIVNLIIDNYDPDHKDKNENRLNVYIDYITYKIYRIDIG